MKWSVFAESIIIPSFDLDSAALCFTDRADGAAGTLNILIWSGQTGRWGDKPKHPNNGQESNLRVSVY